MARRRRKVRRKRTVGTTSRGKLRKGYRFAKGGRGRTIKVKKRRR